MSHIKNLIEDNFICLHFGLVAEWANIYGVPMADVESHELREKLRDAYDADIIENNLGVTVSGFAAYGTKLALISSLGDHVECYGEMARIWPNCIKVVRAHVNVKVANHAV